MPWVSEVSALEALERIGKKELGMGAPLEAGSWGLSNPLAVTACLHCGKFKPIAYAAFSATDACTCS